MLVEGNELLTVLDILRNGNTFLIHGIRKFANSLKSKVSTVRHPNTLVGPGINRSAVSQACPMRRLRAFLSVLLFFFNFFPSSFSPSFSPDWISMKTMFSAYPKMALDAERASNTLGLTHWVLMETLWRSPGGQYLWCSPGGSRRCCVYWLRVCVCVCAMLEDLMLCTSSDPHVSTESISC